MVTRRSFRVFHQRQLVYTYDLLCSLVGRDLKVKYKRSVVGIAWSLINPLMQLLVFYFIFRVVLALEIPRYASFAFSGVIVWTWFQTSLFQGATSITDNRELIRQPGFPAAILPVVAVMTNLINFLMSVPVLVLFLANDDGQFSTTIWALPLLIVLQFALTLSLTYLVAALNVAFRDTQHLLGVFLQLFFYLTPVFYDTSTVPALYRPLYNLNPMVHLMGAYRDVLLEGVLPNWQLLLGLGLIATSLLFLGYQLFIRVSYRFVEEL